MVKYTQSYNLSDFIFKEGLFTWAKIKKDKNLKTNVELRLFA